MPQSLASGISEDSRNRRVRAARTTNDKWLVFDPSEIVFTVSEGQ
jgi:hypothetical protein